MAKIFKFKRAYTAQQKEIVIKILQLLRGMNNSEAARECGVANGTVSKWRTRRTKCPSMTSALKVAAAMGCTLKIVDGDDERDERRPRRQAEDRPRVH